MNKREKISGCELKTMGVIWSKWKYGELTSGLAIAEKLNLDREEPYSYQTILTFLARLEKKGYVSKYKCGRVSYWWPNVSREEWAEYAVKELCEILTIPSAEIISEIISLL